MRLEDSTRFQLWRQAMLKLGLKVEQITSYSWELSNPEYRQIALITYDPDKHFDNRFSVSNPNVQSKQVKDFEASLKILDNWIAACDIDLKASRADALKGYREYLLSLSRADENDQ
jgi:hypothetical protein